MLLELEKIDFGRNFVPDSTNFTIKHDFDVNIRANQRKKLPISMILDFFSTDL
jgi:hypothetical protein